jgi:hypothetical protein
LKLSLRSLALSGFIENRGMVLIAAGSGVLSEIGALDSLVDAVLGEQASGRGAIRHHDDSRSSDPDAHDS